MIELHSTGSALLPSVKARSRLSRWENGYSGNTHHRRLSGLLSSPKEGQPSRPYLKSSVLESNRVGVGWRKETQMKRSFSLLNPQLKPRSRGSLLDGSDNRYPSFSGHGADNPEKIQDSHPGSGKVLFLLWFQYLYW